MVQTSNVVVGDSDLGDDVGTLGESSLLQTLVFLQCLSNHLQLCIHVSHEEVPHPTVRQ